MQLEHSVEERNAIEIEIPLMLKTKISFEFNPVSPFGEPEELLLRIHSALLPEIAERGNTAGSVIPVNLPSNTSGMIAKLSISGLSRIYPGAKTWNNSEVKLLLNKPYEKIIGFNSTGQPDNYESIHCKITFYL